MLYKKILNISFLIICVAGHTQTVNEVLKKVGKQYSLSKPLQYKSSYVLYKDIDSKKAEESYKGVFYKNALNEMYSKIGQTEMLNSKKANLKISHAEKAIQISNPINSGLGNFDIKQLLDFCKIGAFKNYKAYWEITLLAKTFSSLPYSKIVVQVSKNYFVQKQIFYYNTATNFSKDFRKPDPHYPRLEIINSDFNRNAVNASLFNSDRYFTLSNKKSIRLSEKFKNYEVIDQRNISNK